MEFQANNERRFVFVYGDASIKSSMRGFTPNPSKVDHIIIVINQDSSVFNVILLINNANRNCEQLYQKKHLLSWLTSTRLQLSATIVN